MKDFMKYLTLIIFFLACFTSLNSAYSMRGFSLSDNFLSNNKRQDYETLHRYVISAKKRSCIRRGRSCDNRPNDCCLKCSCRCNLFGTNCRCQRLGLFQRLGK